MKTTKVTLQGQDFVFSSAAEPVLLKYLKKLQRATRLRPGAYRQSVEALRDVLLGEKTKTVSKVKLSEAIELVGLPDQKTPVESLTQRFPRTKTPVRFISHLASRIRKMRWQRSLLRLGIAYATVLAAVSAVDAVSSRVRQSDDVGWTVAQTSIGPVRTWVEASLKTGAGEVWPRGWMVGLVYSFLFVILAVSLFYAGRKKRVWPVAGVFASIVLLTILWNTQQVSTPKLPREGQMFMGGSAEPLKPRLAYLQQCGDEIPYVFEGQTSGMLFRQLRDEGYKLAAPIKTRVSDGTIDTAQLCSTYDALRRDQPKESIVLQNYTQTADGTIRPYDFSDISDQTVTSSYGFFVKTQK